MGGTTCGTCQRKIPTSPAGLPGKNAYTFLTASFTMPAAAASVTVTVSNAGQFGNRWAVVGQIIFIQGAGFFQVAAIVGTNQLTVTNLGYVINAAPTSTIGSGGYISPAGPIGATGTSGGNGVNGTARLYEVLTTQTSATTFANATLASYSIPANTLVNDGDSLVIEAWMVQSGSITFGQPSRRITIAGQSATIFGGIQEPRIVLQSTNSALLRIEIIKTSVNTATSRVIVDQDITLPSIKYTVALTALDFTVSNPLVLSVFQVVASGTELRSLTVDKIASI
jgi:hypothetical protein